MARTKKKVEEVNEIKVNGFSDNDDVVEIEYDGNKVSVKKRISYNEMIKLVDNVVKMCFGKDGSYKPENKHYAIMKETVSTYSDADLPDVDSAAYEILYKTEIYKNIINVINTNQYEDIIKSINEKVDNISKANIQYIYKQMNDVMNSMNSISKSVNNAFGGVSKEDISKLMSAVSNGKLDEEKIVKAYMKNKK